MKNDFQCGSGIMTLNSPGGSTMQCNTWLWDDIPLNTPKRLPYWKSTSGFLFDHIATVGMSFCTSLRNFIQTRLPTAEKWLHPAMWHVALESWQWIHQVAAPCKLIRGSGMTCHWIRPNFRHIGILHLVSISTQHRSRHVILYQSAKFYPNRTTLGRKKWRHVDFQDGGSQPSWILGMQ